MSYCLSSSLFVSLLSRLWAIIPILAMGCLSLRAEGLPMDTRVRQLHTERSQHSPLPLPADVSFADVIGNDFDAFHDENHTHKEGTHAFFIKLGNKTALALGFEKGIDGKGPTEIRYKGQPVKLGPLLRKPPNTERSMMWVWEVELPPGAVPLVRERLPLPLILWKDEMTVLTSKGPKQGTLTDRYFRGPFLPGHAVDGSTSLEMDDGDAYDAIRIGDPVIQTSTGIVVGAVKNKIPGIESIKSPADCGIVWLSFPRPPEALSTPLEEVWGAAVPSHPSLDEAIVQRFMPARVFGTKIGEKVEDVWERNPLFHRLPPEAKDQWSSVDRFGKEWVFSQQSIASEEGRVASIHFGSSASIGSKTTLTFIQWMAEKLQHPKELRKTPKGDHLLAIWNPGPVWVATTFALSDKTITLSLFVAGKEAEIKERYNVERLSVAAGADKSTFVSLATALASQAQLEDFGVTNDLALSNPVIAGSAEAVTKRNAEDTPAKAPAGRPIITQKAEETRDDSPASSALSSAHASAISKRKAEIRRQAVQRVEHIGMAAQAFNALPEETRKGLRNKTSGGAFGLLVDHANKLPNLVLSNELYHTMKWALHYTTKGELKATPALEKLIRVINAEIMFGNAQRTAEHAASVFEAATAAGTTEFDDVKTVEEVLVKLKHGVNGTGAFQDKRFVSKSTPELTDLAAQQLHYDADNKILRYIPQFFSSNDSDVPLECIQELAKLIHPETNPWPNPKAPVTFPTTKNDPSRIAQNLCSTFNAAKATGVTELDNVKTVDEAIRSLNAGVLGAGAFKNYRFVEKTTPEQAVAAKKYLKIDLEKKMLAYVPDGLSPGEGSQKIKFMQAAQSPNSSSGITDEKAQRFARNLVSIYNAAVATGSKDIDQLQTLDAVIQRITTTGLIGGPGPFEGRRFYTKTKPGENEAAKPYLRYDSFTKTLSFSSTDVGARSLAANETRPTVMNVGREVPGGISFGGRTFANAAEMKKALEESDAAAAQATHARNAQALVSIYNEALSSGSNELSDVRTVDQALSRIIAGVKGGGFYKDRLFTIPATPDQVTAAKAYIAFDSRQGTLVYKSPTNDAMQLGVFLPCTPFPEER